MQAEKSSVAILDQLSRALADDQDDQVAQAWVFVDHSDKPDNDPKKISSKLCFDRRIDPLRYRVVDFGNLQRTCLCSAGPACRPWAAHFH